MVRGIVEVSLLDKLDQPLCGEGGYRKDTPYCDKQQRNHINLNAYTKTRDFLGTLPFVKPSVEALFCEDFNTWYYGFNIENESCATTSPEVRKQLRALVEGKQQKEGDTAVAAAEPAKVPTASEIYFDLTKDVPPAKLAGMKKQFRAKAEDVAKRMAEIAEGRKKEEKDKANGKKEEDKRILDLYQESERVCSGAEPDVLKKVAIDCKVIGDEHKIVQGYWNQVGGFVKGIAILVGLWVLRNGKKAANVWDAIVNRARGSGEAWKKGGFTGWMGHVFRTIGEVNDAVDGKEPVAQGGGEAGGAGQAPVPAPEPEKTTGPGSVVEGKGSDVPFSVRAEADPAKALKAATVAIGRIVEIAKGENGDGKAIVDKYDGMLAETDGDPASGLARLARVLYSDETLGDVEGLALGFSSRFLRETLPAVSTAMTHAVEDMEGGRDEEAHAKLKPWKEAVDDVHNRMNLLFGLHAEYGTATKAAEAILDVPSGTKKNAEASLLRTLGLIHDPMHIVRALVEMFRRSANPKDFRDEMRTVKMFDISNVNSLLEAMSWLNMYEAKRKKVTVEISPLGRQLVIPERYRADLLRAMFTLTSNAIKYSRDAKGEKGKGVVHLKAALNGNILSLISADNGVGMNDEDIKAAKKGRRLHPELADGSGTGISVVLMGLREKYGCEVLITGKRGEGTTFTINFDVSKWSGSNGQGGEGDGEERAIAASSTAAPASGLKLFGGAEAEAMEALDMVPLDPAAVLGGGASAFLPVFAAGGLMLAGAIPIMGI